MTTHFRDPKHVEPDLTPAPRPLNEQCRCFIRYPVFLTFGLTATGRVVVDPACSVHGRRALPAAPS